MDACTDDAPEDHGPDCEMQQLSGSTIFKSSGFVGIQSWYSRPLIDKNLSLLMITDFLQGEGLIWQMHKIIFRRQ